MDEKEKFELDCQASLIYNHTECFRELGDALDYVPKEWIADGQMQYALKRVEEELSHLLQQVGEMISDV